MALTLTPLIPATRSGRTLAAALTLLGLVGVAQLLVLGIYLIGGGVPAHRTAAETTENAGSSVPNRAETQGLTAPTPAINLPNPAVAQETPALAIARPTPAPVLRSLNGPTDLLEQARQLRSRGDMNSALARLREAEVAEPDSPQIIAEMALTYEAMQMPDRAYEQWQRIYNQGEAVGALYNLADTKLHSVPTATAPAAVGSPVAGGLAAASPEAGGFQGQGDTVLKLTDITKEDLEDPAAEQKIALKIVVKSRPGTLVNPDQVKILAYFYDLVDGKSIVQTNAQTEYAWLSTGRIDWANDKSEVLQTTYTRLKAPAPVVAPVGTPPAKKNSRHKGAAEASPAPTAAASPEPVRTYVGYCVQLYYNGQLQDVQADPVRLLQQFPAPLTLPVE